MSFTISQTPNETNMYLYPDSDSSVSMTAISGATNYLMINDDWQSPNDNTFIFPIIHSNTHTDIYGLENASGLSSGSINYVNVIARARCNTKHGSEPKFRLFTKVSTTTESSATLTANSGTHLYYSLHMLNPSGATWTASDINDLQVGIDAEEIITTPCNHGIYLRADDFSNIPSGTNYSNNMEIANKYLFTVGASEPTLNVIDITTGSTVTSYTHTKNTTASNIIFWRSLSIYEDVANEIIYVAIMTYDDYLYLAGKGARSTCLTLFKFDISTETLIKIGEKIQTGIADYINLRASCSIDDKMIVVVCLSYLNTGIACRVESSVYSYTSSSITDRILDELILSGIAATSGSMWNCLTYDGASNKKYFITAISGNYTTSFKLIACSIDYSTWSFDDYSTIDRVTNPYSRVLFDGTYIISSSTENRHILYYYTYNGSSITYSSSVTTMDNSGHWIHGAYCFKNSNGYFVITHKNHNHIDIYKNKDKIARVGGLDDTVTSSNKIAMNEYGHVVLNATGDNNLQTYRIGTFIGFTQLYVAVNYIPVESTVTLNMPESLDVSHGRSIKRHVFQSGNYSVDDFGRSGKTLHLRGTETSDVYNTMNSLRNMCHYDAPVTIAGLPDTNLNTDYRIMDFNFKRDAGDVSIYDWELTLEES